MSKDYSDNHTDYKDTWYLHVQIECVTSDYSVVQLDNHNEYNNTLFFHGQTQNVFSDHFYKYIICHIGYKDTLTPQELI